MNASNHSLFSRCFFSPFCDTFFHTAGWRDNLCNPYGCVSPITLLHFAPGILFYIPHFSSTTPIIIAQRDKTKQVNQKLTAIVFCAVGVNSALGKPLLISLLFHFPAYHPANNTRFRQNIAVMRLQYRCQVNAARDTGRMPFWNGMPGFLFTFQYHHHFKCFPKE